LVAYFGWNNLQIDITRITTSTEEVPSVARKGQRLHQAQRAAWSLPPLRDSTLVCETPYYSYLGLGLIRAKSGYHGWGCSLTSVLPPLGPAGRVSDLASVMHTRAAAICRPELAANPPWMFPLFCRSAASRWVNSREVLTRPLPADAPQTLSGTPDPCLHQMRPPRRARSSL
jgi:hypothetical protein